MLTKDNVALYAAAVTATASSLVAVLVLAGAYFSEKRLRRRTLYAEAYRTALGWLEMVGRVRRRRAGEEFDAQLVDRFHDLQEQLLYHLGWIGSESIYMQRSYQRLVDEIKRDSADLIREAWAEPAGNGGRSLADSRFPDVTESAAQFLLDVRRHLSPWQLPKLAVAWTYRGAKVGMSD